MNQRVMLSMFLLIGCGAPDQTASSTDAVYGVGVDVGGGRVTIDPPKKAPNVPTPKVPVAPETQPGPRIVVLVHGMLTNGGDQGALATGRQYWSFEFVRGLLGAERGGYATLAGSTIISNAQWISEAETVGRITNETAPHAFAYLPEARRTNDDSPLRVEEPPSLSIMMTSRDGSIGLLRQTRRAVDQIALLLEWYRDVRFAEYFSRCDCEPQLVVVGHSMGGLVARTFLSNPTDADIDQTINPDGVSYNATERDRMDMIRDRTKFAITLATPHDGTIFAERGQGLISFAERLPQVLAGAATSDPTLVAADAYVRSLLSLMGASAPTQQQLADALTRLVVEANPGRGAIRDLTRTHMSAANRSYLAPNQARRTAAAEMLLGPGMGNRPIPIYTFGGRSPGSVHFNTFNLVDAIAGLNQERDIDKLNIIIKLVIDFWMAQYPDGYGPIEGVLVPFEAEMDRVARVSYEPAVADLAENVAEQSISDVAQLAIAVGGEDVPGWVRSMVAVDLPDADADFPIWLTEEWKVALTGSVPLRVPVLACGDAVLDVAQVNGLTPALIELANDHAAQMQALIEDGAGLAVVVAVLNAALDLTLNAATIIADAVATYFSSQSLDVACLLPTGWTLTAETRSFPMPELQPTGGAIADGEVDSDGAVTYDSAMGLTLGGNASYAACGAWQRQFDSPFEAEFHEGLPIRGHLGLFLGEGLLLQTGAPCP